MLALDHDLHPKPDTGYTGLGHFVDGEMYAVNSPLDKASMAQIPGYSQSQCKSPKIDGQAGQSCEGEVRKYRGVSSI